MIGKRRWNAPDSIQNNGRRMPDDIGRNGRRLIGGDGILRIASGIMDDVLNLKNDEIK